jgi:hypothetical protein
MVKNQLVGISAMTFDACPAFLFQYGFDTTYEGVKSGGCIGLFWPETVTDVAL